MNFKTTPPHHLVLATDLSARCDRALDRALQLSRAWQSSLTLVHALESVQPVLEEPSWRQPQDVALAIQEELEAEVSAMAEDTRNISVRVVRGRPEDVVLKVAEEVEAGLILTGVKRDSAFDKALLGDTVTGLVRHASIPVLVVKKRLRRPYQKIVVATDLSEPSKVALARAVDLFGLDNLVVFHAAFAHFASRMDDRLAYEGELRSDAIQNCRDFISEVAGAEAVDKIGVVVEYGEPDLLLEKYVQDHKVDLVVVSTHGRSGLLGVLLGSIATRILDSVASDVLIVRNSA
ncbi:Nucleotide-binding universal stress protein, UspA family [Methylobacillus rhizosphaerae]|uniref:Nucleotide-binding universal stress protein, UspA family n=1 Tax=Methylobacillus rhizosphaerae TaxID=551994 RepID=A0A238Z8K6_9PROT|nr:universal stress protein [Methylobacillus rhizosphaerae]SNR79637.1 Nucleotide-binding universal stress protein, UspA family [Methylobacillus rhizosphaerae]